MTQPDQQTRRRFIQVSAATVAAATVPASAAAQSNDDSPSRFMLALASARGWRQGLFQRYLEDRSEAKDVAFAARDEFNQHSEEWVGYVNEHSTLSGDIQVVALEFVPDPDDGEEYVVYLVTDHDGENYTSAEIVDETDREIDERARLESIAAENAADEIETAYEDFVAPGEPPNDEHLAYLAGKYRFGTEHVTSTILGDEFDQ